VKATCVKHTGGFFGVVKRGETWYTMPNQMERKDESLRGPAGGAKWANKGRLRTSQQKNLNRSWPGSSNKRRRGMERANRGLFRGLGGTGRRESTTGSAGRNRRQRTPVRNTSGESPHSTRQPHSAGRWEGTHHSLAVFGASSLNHKSHPSTTQCLRRGSRC